MINTNADAGATPEVVPRDQKRALSVTATVNRKVNLAGLSTDRPGSSHQKKDSL
jgi:hypothetical protein